MFHAQIIPKDLGLQHDECFVDVRKHELLIKQESSHRKISWLP